MSSQAPPPNQPAYDSGFGDRDGTVKIRIGLDDEKPAHAQYIVAAVLAVSLLVIPIALLNRSRTIGKPIAPSPSASAPDPADLVVAAPEEPTAPEVQISAFKFTSCHDSGAKRTAPEQCDRPDALESSVRAAVKDAQSCVPDNTGGAIAYAFDVGFTKKKGSVVVSAPKDGRTLKSGKVAQKCADLVREKLEQQPLEQIKHEHARYKLSLIATYPGPQP
jgi:hypothetical protein